MKLRRPFLPPLLAIVRGIISTVLLVALLLSAWSSGPASAAAAGGEDGPLEIFRLADRSNLKRLNTGDFLFRLPRDLRRGIVSWSNISSTRLVIAFAHGAPWAAADGTAPEAALHLTHLPPAQRQP